MYDLSDLAKYSMPRSIEWSLCDSLASCTMYMYALEVGRYRLCRYRYPLLQRSLAYSYRFIITSKVVKVVSVIP